jgi:cytochrome b
MPRGKQLNAIRLWFLQSAGKSRMACAEPATHEMDVETLMSGMRLSMRVWDAPVRLVHWLLTLLLVFSYLTAQLGWMQLHFLSGYTILSLLLFRIVWGFVGSDTARFSRFIVSPVVGLQHLREFTKKEPDNQIGHNAAGGWMVLVLLALLLLQATTGLFSTGEDDPSVAGPLAHLIGKASDTVSLIHSINFNLILAAVALHVVAIIAYALVKRHDLVRPMVTGKKRLPAATRPPRMASSVLALLVFLCAAGVVALIAIG